MRDASVAQEPPILKPVGPTTIKGGSLGRAPLAQFGSLSHSDALAKARHFSRTIVKVEGQLAPSMGGR